MFCVCQYSVVTIEDTSSDYVVHYLLIFQCYLGQTKTQKHRVTFVIFFPSMDGTFYVLF
jgi:hypothetical protein